MLLLLIVLSYLVHVQAGISGGCLEPQTYANEDACISAEGCSSYSCCQENDGTGNYLLVDTSCDSNNCGGCYSACSGPCAVYQCVEMWNGPLLLGPGSGLVSVSHLDTTQFSPTPFTAYDSEGSQYSLSLTSNAGTSGAYYTIPVGPGQAITGPITGPISVGPTISVQDAVISTYNYNLAITTLSGDTTVVELVFIERGSPSSVYKNFQFISHLTQAYSTTVGNNNGYTVTASLVFTPGSPSGITPPTVTVLTRVLTPAGTIITAASPPSAFTLTTSFAPQLVAPAIAVSMVPFMPETATITLTPPLGVGPAVGITIRYSEEFGSGVVDSFTVGSNNFQETPFQFTPGIFAIQNIGPVTIIDTTYSSYVVLSPDGTGSVFGISLGSSITVQSFTGVLS